MSSLRGLVLGCVSDRSSLDPSQPRPLKRPIKSVNGIMSGRGTSPRPRITVSQPDESSGKEGDPPQGDRQLLEDLMSLVHMTSPVRCYHCHAKFSVPLDAIRHQFLDHVSKEMCLLVPVISSGRTKHRATHYGKSPQEVYTAPQTKPLSATVHKRKARPVSTHFEAQPQTTPSRRRSSAAESESMPAEKLADRVKENPVPQGLMEAPLGLSHFPDAEKHGFEAPKIPQKEESTSLPHPKTAFKAIRDRSIKRVKSMRRSDKSKRHTIADTPAGFDVFSLGEQVKSKVYLRDSFYTLPKSYNELVDTGWLEPSSSCNHVPPVMQGTHTESNPGSTADTPVLVEKIVSQTCKTVESHQEKSTLLDSHADSPTVLNNPLKQNNPVISCAVTTLENHVVLDMPVVPKPVEQPSPDIEKTSELFRVKFGAPLSESLKDDVLPPSLVELIVYIAQEGVTTTDLFRRPGNPTDLKVIMKKLAEGKEVTYTNYNFYTIASVIKKFLLKIPGGVFGPGVENQLLEVLQLDNRMQQYDRIHSIISSLPNGTQQLLALLFGTWFRIVNHSEYNTMSSEAVAKSVAGSLFHTCADDPLNVEKAVRILQILIDDYGTANMFGRKNLKYFAEVTRTGISVKEKYRYEFSYPEEGDPVSLEKYYPLYARYLEREAKKRGFHPQMNAITEEEFYGSPRPRANTRASQEGSMIEIRLPQSSSPSPQSLQPHSRDGDSEFNPHKKLTHVSSLSAPEVNQVGVSGCNSPTQENLISTKRMYLSTSLSRFDNVRRRQILRMKKRSNWFLSPNTSVSMADSESLMGSREASVGKSSLEATSSDALASDVTASDGGLSDTHTPDALRLSSDIDCTFDESSIGLHTGSVCATPARSSVASAHTPLQRLTYVRQDVLNANHGMATSTPIKQSSRKSEPASEPGQNTSQVSVSEKDVRYFMVENYYGGQQNGDS